MPTQTIATDAILEERPKSISLLVVEDHPVYLEGLCMILEELADQVTIHTVEGLQPAEEIIRANPNLDIILLDLSLSDGSGLALLRYIQSKRIIIPVAILSASDRNQDVGLAIQNGASGFISKAKGRSEIINAIRMILKGETYLPDFYREEPALTEIPSLTPRQQEVLELLSEGLPNKRICKELNLTEHTVKTHIKTLYQIFGVHNRTECAAVASDMGFTK